MDDRVGVSGFEVMKIRMDAKGYILIAHMLDTLLCVVIWNWMPKP